MDIIDCVANPISRSNSHSTDLITNSGGEIITSFFSQTTDSPFVPGLDNLYLRHVEDYLTRLMRRERLSHKWTELIKTFCNRIVAKIDLEPVVDPDLKVTILFFGSLKLYYYSSCQNIR